jgi:DNA-binding NarL/FixJ family response regulator
MTIKVYIADDHTIVRDGICSLLEDHPEIVVVGCGANGRQAVSDVKALHPDVVVMDISMPELNGIDATRQILDIFPEVNVVILSMLGNSEHIFRALQAGAKGYLLKESDGQEMIEAVLTVSSGKRYFSQPVTDTLVNGYLQQRIDAAEKSPIEKLSQREREILTLVASGKSSAEIGETLHISPKTVDTYRSRMMEKLGVKDLPTLIRYAIQQGLIPLDLI